MAKKDNISSSVIQRLPRYYRFLNELDKEIVDQSVAYIRSHLSEKLSLSTLARDAAMNPNYFNKVFKEQMGDTVNQFIIKEKMALAAQLLLEGNLKSYAIAESLGYDNYANFVNMFKKIYGKSPNTFQEERRPGK